MSISSSDASKKRKRSPKIFSFHSFCDPDCPIITSESFRDRIRFFLRECGEIESYHINAMPVWCTLMVQESKGGIVVPLYTIEETVKDSDQPYCDHCRCCGWSHHFVSRRRYHIFIPADAEWKNPLSEDVLDTENHLLHGMIHSNGYGHLLSINGIEGGSKYLTGREIMDLWDRICTSLHVRKIEVEDLSKKRSMHLRLLHGVAYGHPWFGKWGYRFCSGSFGVEDIHYHRAIEFLSSMYLDDIVVNCKEQKGSQDISSIVRCYRDMSETQLNTLQELLKFMLTIKSRAPTNFKVTIRKNVSSSSVALPQLKPYSTRACPQVKQCPKEKDKSVKCRKFATLVASLDSRWPTRRLEYAATVIVDALKEKRESDPLHKGMTRQEVRDAARLHIGDTGLLDYVLKSMNDVIVGNYIVRRAINPTNRILEYTIEDHIDGGCPQPAPEVVEPCISKCLAPPILSSVVVMPGVDIYGDIIWLYQNVLMGFPESDDVGLAVRMILDSKRFVKEWPMRDEDQMLRFVCKVFSNSMEFDLNLDKRSGPGEVVAVPLHATIGELKESAGKALRDTYCLTARFQVQEIVSLEGLNDEELVFGLLESGSEIWVRGVGLDMKPELRHEGGPENWTVKCDCGARDDDGERMVSCDSCEIWQHTRCIGIQDSEAVPALYLCQKCYSSFAPEIVESNYELENCTDTYLLPLEEDYGLQMMQY